MPLVRKNTVAPADLSSAAAPDALIALTQGDRDQRWMAARTLSDVEALGRALSTEADASVREAIFNTLISLGGPRGVDAILPHLRADDAGLRTGALDALKVMAAEVAPRLGALLADPDPDMRLLSCEIVRELPGAQATPLLCAVLEVEDQANVCGAAIEALAEIADPEALPFLAGCAARFANEPFLLFAIAAAASRLGAASSSSPPEADDSGN